MTKFVRYGLVLMSLALTGNTLMAQSIMHTPAKNNIEFAGPDGTKLKGYLALPTGNEARPGVVLIHEWWGLNVDVARLADALAKEGFVVLAADAYRGKLGTNPDEARALSRGTPAAQIAADLDAAFKFLQSHSRVKNKKVAAWGFCFGGSQTQRMASRQPDLSAALVFYGGGPFQKAEELGAWSTSTPVLGVYGKLDAGIPLEQVRAFEAALDSRKIPATFTVYPGVGHAFVKSDTYEKPGPASQAWKQAIEFLKNTLN